MEDLATLICAADAAPDRPVLIAGPTASGKSALALALAEATGRSVVNADALQVFDAWPVLTAQPGAEDRARARHLLYGYLRYDADYSVGHWLRAVAPLLAERPAPVLAGGTGLYFTALTEGLAEIPATDPALRAEADAILARDGVGALIDALDPATRARIDLANPVRVQRAWEVLRQTGRGLAHWQADTPPPLLPTDRAICRLLEAPTHWLTPRIERRADAMLAGGALAEARAMADRFDPRHLSSRVIGAQALLEVLADRLSESDAAAAIIVATRQYAKRQRTWFARRMQGWLRLNAAMFGGYSAQHSGNSAQIGHFASGECLDNPATKT